AAGRRSRRSSGTCSSRSARRSLRCRTPRPRDCRIARADVPPRGGRRALATSSPHPSPDVVLLGAEWKTRALIRAQLIEEGFDVVATDTWSMMRRQLRPGLKPRLAVVDLKDLDEPGRVLGDLAVLMKPERVLVLAAAATM